MGAALTKGEQSLAADGKQEVVLNGRREFQDTIEADAVIAVEARSGRRVAAMSNNHIDPDLAVEVFILEPRA